MEDKIIVFENSCFFTKGACRKIYTKTTCRTCRAFKPWMLENYQNIISQDKISEYRRLQRVSRDLRGIPK